MGKVFIGYQGALAVRVETSREAIERDPFLRCDRIVEHEGRAELVGGKVLFNDEIDAEKIAALKVDYEATVEGWLADFANTRGYKVSNMGAYANSTNPTFKAEALYYIAVQDRTWEACYDILNAVLAGTRPVPTKEELYAELPVSTAQWPTPNPTAEQAAAI